MHTATSNAGRTAAAQQDLLRLFVGMWTTQAVATAARLGVAEHLAATGPQTPTDVARDLGVHRSSLRRLMRTLASVGVFAPVGEGRYGLTPVGELLCASHPGSLKHWFIAETDPVHWQSWERMIDAVRTGQPQPPMACGTTVFGYYAAHADDAQRFGLAMADISRLTAHAVVDSYDFSGVRQLVDVGGGNGSLALAILERHPRPHAIVLDLPHSADHATAAIAAAGAGARCRFEAGDFFAKVPEGADLHLLKFILHDWSDEDCLRILRRCREAIAPDGRLVVVELLLPEENRPDFVQFMDLNMLVMTGGLERTAAEYGVLLDRAGFRLARVIPTSSPFQLIEGAPVSSRHRSRNKP
jgi:SAM-dependent methyltransferase